MLVDTRIFGITKATSTMKADKDHDKDPKSNGGGGGAGGGGGNKESKIAADGTNLSDLRGQDEEESKSIALSTTQSGDKSSSSMNKPTATTKNKLPVSKKPTQSKKKKRKHKPYGFPRRPLSAYNIFFKDTREKIMEAEGKKPFQELVRMVAERWNCITFQDKEQYELRAADDMERYKRQVKEFEKNANKVQQGQETQGGDDNTASGTSQADRSSSQHESRSGQSETTMSRHQQYQQSRSSGAPGAMDGQRTGILGDMGVRSRGQGLSLQPSDLDRLTDEELVATRHHLEMDLHAVEQAMARRLLRRTPGATAFDTSSYARQNSGVAAPSDFSARQLGRGDASSNFDFRHMPLAPGNRPVGLAGPLSFTNPTDVQLQLRLLQERGLGNMGGGGGSLYGNMDRSWSTGFMGSHPMNFTDESQTAQGSRTTGRSWRTNESTVASSDQRSNQLLSHLTDEELRDLVQKGRFPPR